MFDHVDGFMGALAKKKTQWNEDWYFAAMWTCQTLSQECAEVTPTMCMQVNVDINFVSVWKM
jgi:hypothetical protein